MSHQRLPILAPNGRDVIGYSTTKNGAEHILRRLLTIHPRMTLNVFRRNPVTREINGGPDGFMYNIFYGY